MYKPRILWEKKIKLRKKLTNITSSLAWVDKILAFIEDKLTGICMIVMVAAVIYGVLMRFVFRLPNQYGEEISRYF